MTSGAGDEWVLVLIFAGIGPIVAGVALLAFTRWRPSRGLRWAGFVGLAMGVVAVAVAASVMLQSGGP